jgi:hypothetical protein
MLEKIFPVWLFWSRVFVLVCAIECEIGNEPEVVLPSHFYHTNVLRARISTHVIPVQPTVWGKVVTVSLSACASRFLLK